MELDKLITSLDLNDDEYIVIGVSTGPDSMALLNLLMKNIDKKIVCAHINHSVRKESNEEAKYLKNYCQITLSISLTILTKTQVILEIV